VTPSATQRALVLAPHPDDESLGCGGTLKLITDAGGVVDVLYMTSGENGFFPGVIPTPEERQALSAKRQAEAREACRLLGARKVTFLPGADGALHTQPQLADSILTALMADPYRSVFCPWPQDGHPDHATTYALFHKALTAFQRELDVFLYEVWTPMPANLFIGIDQTIESKMQAFNAHQSQATLLNYASGFEGLARYRGLFCPPASFAEAFYRSERSDLLSDQSLPWARSR
jgi:LmbE family N-acetylglucosaminyl deacetylase